ncbi:rRNA processing protein Rrp8 [Paecilomyces variotii No. 5]|uniref:Ribosomal RNA-processing protein 8 n=1 Tax=Byssochlamys spectabilis (strain No. 5 / NBRC 109023) TaxID=1356009 RepID=V5FW04_BYSSN|nr:rRNA processing protein Rrp8 [Paecilomyces variotii No. 5]
MFAVPGWSVPTSALKQQTETGSKAVQARQNAEKPRNDAGAPDQKAKKRKRGTGPDDNVTKANLELMFRRHIEGSAGKGNTKKDKKKGKMPGAADGGKGTGMNAIPVGQPKANGSQQTDRLEAAQEKQQEANTDGHDVPQKNKRRKKNKGTEPSDDATGGQTNGTSAPVEPLPAAPPTTTAKLTPLQQAMRQKLLSARFRHLNQTLYTTPSTEALDLFTANPELFEEYHAGFSRQVKESWPSNPVDGYIKAIRTRGAVHPSQKKQQKGSGKSNGPSPLPRRPNGLCTIADLGCGDAQLARSLTPSAKKLNLKLLSYDLHVPDPLVTKADISNLPLEDGTVDLTIFCLSLMGTNWVSFVEEAWRVLRSDGKGECWVSEVKSRFGKVTRKKAQIGAKKPLSKTQQKKQKKKGPDDAGSDVEDDAEIYAEDAQDAASNNDETDVSAFVEVFRTRGFVLKQESLDKSNKMFVKMEFVKQGVPTKGKYASSAPAAGPPGRKWITKLPTDNSMTPEEEAKVLKPCVYKTR